LQLTLLQAKDAKQMRRSQGKMALPPPPQFQPCNFFCASNFVNTRAESWSPGRETRVDVLIVLDGLLTSAKVLMWGHFTLLVSCEFDVSQSAASEISRENKANNALYLDFL
jgi:hypothetical protein